jgi:hypothetical protein
MRPLLITLTILLLAIPCMAQTQLTFAWDLSTDDSLLGAGGGYTIYYGKVSGTYLGTVGKVAPGVNTMTVTRPGLGKYYFVATSVTADGTESGYSNEVSTVIKPAAPKLNTVQQVAANLKGILVDLASILKGKQTLRIVK